MQTDREPLVMLFIDSATLADLAGDTSCTDFQKQVAASCGVEPACQHFKAGFPPQRLDMQGQTIADLGISNGETLILERASGSSTTQQVHAGRTEGSRGTVGTGVAGAIGALSDGRFASLQAVDMPLWAPFNLIPDPW